MSKPLSERLEAASRGGDALASNVSNALLREAAALARRVEGAPAGRLEFGDYGGQSLHLRDADMESLMLRGQRVALVPAEAPPSTEGGEDG